MAGAALSIPCAGRGQEDVCEKVCAKVCCVWSRRPRSRRLENESGTGPAGTTGEAVMCGTRRVSATQQARQAAAQAAQVRCVVEEACNKGDLAVLDALLAPA